VNTNIVTSVVAFNRSDLEDMIGEQVYWLTHTRPDYSGLPETGPVTVEYALGFLDLNELHEELRDLAQSKIYSAILDAQLNASMLVRDEYSTDGILA
jgi:hypothetical protein